MFRPWIVAVVVVATLAAVPAAAQAAVTSSAITHWTSSETGTPPDATYLVSYDNPGAQATSLTVEGTAQGSGNVDVVCYYGSGSSFGDAVLASNVPVSDGTFTVTAPLHPIGGHACRLRAIPSGQEARGTDAPSFAGPHVAVSQGALSAFVDPGDQTDPYDFYIVGTTFSAYAGWNSAGSCGVFAAPIDSSFGIGNFAIDCMGSLLDDADLPTGQDRSEVQVDGQNAYDAASAQAMFGGAEDLTDFPTLTAHAISDPSDGLISSQSTEGLVVCAQPVSYPPNSTTCPTFASAGVQLERTITTSDGGLVTTLTDTWSSTDGQAHSLDLLYDDYTGLKSSSAQRSYEFPGEPGFAAYQAPTTLPGPSSAPGTILVHVNADSTRPEGYGAITFSQPATGYRFVSNNEFEEHQLLQVPAGGSASLSYVYSIGDTAAQAEAPALAAQDDLEVPAVAVSSPPSGSTVSTASVELTGTAVAGSGITSLAVGGQGVALDPSGSWKADVALQAGANTITVVATDRAGATVQTQMTVVYQPPTQSPTPPPPPPVKCKIPRTKGMKQAAAERALRLAHCRVGRIKHERSKKERKGRVLSTSPPVGRVFAAKHRVELFVSKGAR